MSYAGSVMSSIAIAAGTGQEMYGDWYEGEQQRNYYRNQAQITAQKKKISEAEIANQERIAADQAKGAEYQRNLDDLKIAAYKEQSERLGSTAYVRFAKSNVDVSQGSPLAYLTSLADARAKEAAVMSWQRDVTEWKGQSQAAITLDAANIQRAQLPLYDYQYQLYALAGEEAAKIAAKKVRAAAIAAVGKANQAWSGSFGKMGGAGTGGSSGGGGGEGAGGAGAG